jgi:hypothetical protein
MANIELDGANKKIKVDSGDLTLDVPGDIILDADGADLVFADGGTNILKVTNSSSDVVLQPQVDAKDIIFKQYDGTTVATVEDNGTFNIPTDKLAINGTAVTATAAEINLIDGGTARGTTAIADGDGVLINDAGTMRQTTVETLKTYVGGDNTPAFEAYLSSSSSQISDDTDTKVAFNTEIYDTDSTYDNSSNYRFTPAVAGKYYIYGKVSFDDTNIAANTDEHMVKIYKNGSQESVYYQFATGNDNYLVFAEVLDLDGDDYIEIYAKINNSNGGRVIRGASSNQKYTTFGAFRITGV